MGELGFGLLMCIALLGYAITTWLSNKGNKENKNNKKN